MRWTTKQNVGVTPDDDVDYCNNLITNRLPHDYLRFIVSLVTVAAIESIVIPTLLPRPIHGGISALQQDFSIFPSSG